MDNRYIEVETYAEYESEEEYEANRYGDESPLATLMVRDEFLKSFAEKGGYASLDEFMSEYTYEDTRDLQFEAAHAGALAFAYRHTLSPHYQLPKTMDREQVRALMKHLEEEPILDRVARLLPQNPQSGAEVFALSGCIMCRNEDDVPAVNRLLGAMGAAKKDLATRLSYVPRQNEVRQKTTHGGRIIRYDIADALKP